MAFRTRLAGDARVDECRVAVPHPKLVSDASTPTVVKQDQILAACVSNSLLAFLIEALHEAIDSCLACRRP